MENPAVNDKEVLTKALAAIEKAEELYAAGKTDEAADLWLTARKAVREQFDQNHLLGSVN